MGRTVIGIILGLVLAPVALLAWFHWGHPPVAVADPPLPIERWVTHVALNARIQSEMPTAAPIQADEGNLAAGAQIFRDQCAACHGFQGKVSTFAAHMYPRAPQLWEKHGNSDVVGVSDDPPGETVWKVTNGIRLTGMPAYRGVLTETQIWQVSLLLASADKPLPAATQKIVQGEEPPAVKADAAAQRAK
ncbi:MAG: cytochrome c [Terracidiphilus sp.]|jgi:mono/diheme cytochrome c family protein